MTTSRHRAIRRGAFGDLATGISAAVVVFIAVPMALWEAVGAPRPGHWQRPVGPEPFVYVLAAIAGVAWLSCCRPLVCSVIDRVRRGGADRTGDPWLIDRLASRIAAAVLVVLPLTLASLPDVAGADTSQGLVAIHASAAGLQGPTHVPESPSETITADVGAANAVSSWYTVADGDSLWSIAQSIYGDGTEWHALARTNLGRLMRDGRRFVDPSMIRPGWVLAIPDASGQTELPTFISEANPTSARSDRSRAPRSPETGRNPGGLRSDISPRQTGPRGTAHRRSRHGRSSGEAPALPALAILGLGTLGAAALARRVRRVRVRRLRARHTSGNALSVEGIRTFARGDRLVTEALSEEAVDLATLVQPFEETPLLEWLDVANRHLESALATMASGDEAPAVRLFRVGDDGVDAMFTSAVPWCPDRWEQRDDGATWHLSSSQCLTELVAECRFHQPRHPALLPVGDDGASTWLAVVERGECLPVLGAHAEEMVAAMSVSAGGWPWADGLVVTSDPGVAEREARLQNVAVVFFGDPAGLSRSARALCSVVTALPAPATHLTVVVDAYGATIHPLGVTLRAHVLRSTHQKACEELLERANGSAVTHMGPSIGDRAQTTGATQATGDGWATDGQVTRRHGTKVDPRVVPTGPEGTDRILGPPLLPGHVEVRLLAPIPRIEGLDDPLPQKRARRAVELVAYLALHHPEPVTSDRLRTRVLGSADADAASKTLFNVATAARRALGTDPDGVPYLPGALKTGHYRISDLVTTDVDRAARIVAAAERATDEETAMALYRVALELVEGEPLSGALSGYAWWQTEGHAGRVQDLLIDASCALSELATSNGYYELARWALGQARNLDSYSETLTRAAMRAAAASGDVDRLRREWLDCRRMMEDLDPGSLPSERTERLYGELASRICSPSEVRDADRALTAAPN